MCGRAKLFMDRWPEWNGCGLLTHGESSVGSIPTRSSYASVVIWDGISLSRRPRRVRFPFDAPWPRRRSASDFLNRNAAGKHCPWSPVSGCGSMVDRQFWVLENGGSIPLTPTIFSASLVQWKDRIPTKCRSAFNSSERYAAFDYQLSYRAFTPKKPGQHRHAAPNMRL